MIHTFQDLHGTETTDVNSQVIQSKFVYSNTRMIRFSQWIEHVKALTKLNNSKIHHTLLYVSPSLYVYASVRVTLLLKDVSGLLLRDVSMQ